jgi:hypothetical protein
MWHDEKRTVDSAGREFLRLIVPGESFGATFVESWIVIVDVNWKYVHNCPCFPVKSSPDRARTLVATASNDNHLELFARQMFSKPDRAKYQVYMYVIFRV